MLLTRRPMFLIQLLAHLIHGERSKSFDGSTGSRSRSKLTATCLESCDMLGEASTRGTETERVGQRLGIKGRKRKKEGPQLCLTGRGKW